MTSNLNSQLRRSIRQTNSALAIVGQLAEMKTMPRHYIAELLLLRTFALFESVVEESACGLVCGAAYCDGSLPSLLRPKPTRGFERARKEMQVYNRDKPKFQLRWTKASDIRENLHFLFPHTEHFTTTLASHGTLIANVRKVRNHIVHRNSGTHKKFQEVVLQEYGATVPSIVPGRMLMSSRFSPSLLDQWCRKLQIVAKETLRGEKA